MMESSTLLTTITVRIIVDRGMDELSCASGSVG